MPPPTLPRSAYEDLDLPAETVKILTAPQFVKPTPNTTAAPNLMLGEATSEKRLAPDESSITLYAELLLHTRTIALYASLRTGHTRETKATLSADGSEITVSHEGESATIRLPIKMGEGGDAALSLPAEPLSKDLTLRLQLEEKEGSDFFGVLLSEERKANIVPWDGASLNEMQGVKVCCQGCGESVVAQGSMREWRDLPNENWAEMMDFWHCHKPDEHHLHDHRHEEVVGKKGYAAGNKLTAARGVGFVDLASLLLDEQDCEGIQVVSDDEIEGRLLTCKHCKGALGTVDESANGWRLWKWCIGIASSTSAFTTYSMEKWISARLLFLIENQGVRRFHIHPDIKSSAPTPSLLVWVFTPDLLFSSSIPSKTRLDPTRTMKVFYQEQTWTPLKPGEQESASTEEVCFPKALFERLKGALEESQRLLPSCAREFQGWHVGLLERFDVGELEQQ